MQVGTYPTRNFAHFFPALSRRSGLYLHPVRESRTIQLVSGAQRIVSEDPPDQKTRSFLRIVQSHAIITDRRTDRVGWALRMFPHIAECYDAHYCASRQRYSCHLRTVIVTAAVYWGFRSKLWACALTSPFNLPAPGRSQPLYVRFRVRRDLCFC